MASLEFDALDICRVFSKQLSASKGIVVLITARMSDALLSAAPYSGNVSSEPVEVGALFANASSGVSAQF